MSNLSGRGPMGLKAGKAERGTAAAKAHMAAVARLPCVCCGAWPVSVHHVISGRFSQRKASDMEVIPLCWNDHQGPDGIHTNKRSWEERWGPDTGFLEQVRNAVSRD